MPQLCETRSTPDPDSWYKISTKPRKQKKSKRTLVHRIPSVSFKCRRNCPCLFLLLGIFELLGFLILLHVGHVGMYRKFLIDHMANSSGAIEDLLDFFQGSSRGFGIAVHVRVSDRIQRRGISLQSTHTNQMLAMQETSTPMKTK